MDKLEYDSLHKFLVSLGLIFIGLPFIMLYLFFNSDPLLISQKEYDMLSNFSKNQIVFHERLTRPLLSALPIVCIFSILVGVALLIIGIKNWGSVQKNLDAAIEAGRIKQELDIERMKNSEKLERTRKEVNEAADATVSLDQSAEIELTGIKKFLDIEDRYFAHTLSNSFKRRYTLLRDLRIGRYEYDGIAISLKDNTDLIYEIKYWKSPGSTRFFSRTIKHLYEAGVNYETTKHRNFRCILSIIAPAESLEKIRHFTERFFSNNVDFVSSIIEIQYIAEEDI